MSATGIFADDIVLVRAGRRLLDEVSLSLKPGALAMLIGPNGAGKSTLLRVLAGTLVPDSGTVRIDGDAVRGMPVRRLAQRRAVVPQSTEVAFRFRAREVVELGLGDGRTSARVVDDAMRLAGCDAFATRFHADLSGGERARVHVARALAQLRIGAREGDEAGDCEVGRCPPRYLLLDEPVASLDPGQQHRLLGLLAELARHHALGVLVTMHDLNLASQYAQRVWLLEQGRLVTVGPADEVVRDAWIGPVFDVDMRRLAGDRPAHPAAVATVRRAASPPGAGP